MNEAALRRLNHAGLRGWEDSRNGQELIRDLGELHDSGSVPAHLTIHFKKHYQRGWAETARAGRWPWPDEELPLFAVTEASSLSVVDGGEDARLFVPDEDDHFKDSLLDLAGYPVLVNATEDGVAERRLLELNGVEVRGFTDTDIQIEADGEVIVASSDRATRGVLPEGIESDGVLRPGVRVERADAGHVQAVELRRRDRVETLLAENRAANGSGRGEGRT